MVARSAVVLLSVFLVVLSGCVSSPDPPAGGETVDTTAPEPTVTAGFGSISGTVVDDEKVPVSGVEVGLIELGRNEYTDAEGAFTFNDVPPGRHGLATQKLGYDPVARSVEVVDGEVVTIELTVQAMELPVDPIIHSVPVTGYIECSMSVYYFVSPCHGVLGDNEDHFAVEIDPAFEFHQIILELVWIPGSAATGQELEVDLCKKDDVGTTSSTGCAAADAKGDFFEYQTGTSPVILSILAEGMPLDKTLSYEAWVGSGFMGTVTSDPYLFPAIQQSFTLHITTCYVAPCPEGYTALPPQ